MATSPYTLPDDIYSAENLGGSSRALLTELMSTLAGHEKGLMRSGFIQSLGGADHNPSPIAQKTFKEMSFDPQIRAGQQILNFAILSKGYSFRYPGEDKEFGQEMITYLTKAFQLMNRNINQNGGAWFVMRDMLENGSTYGYSIAETVLGEIGEIDPDKIYPVKLKVLPNETLEDCFRISDFGDLEAVIQNRGRQGQVIFDDENDLSRLLVYSHLKKSGNWYGVSNLLSIFDSWYAKNYIRKFYWIYLERFAAPFLVGTVQNPNHMNDMNLALDSSRTKTCFTVIAGDEVKMLESSHNEGFLEALKYLDTQIMMGLLVPTLLLGIEATGARSLGDVHFSTFLWHVRAIQREFADTWQSLINFLINLNFESSRVDGIYPELIFPVVATRDMGYMADAIYKLVTGGVISPDEDWIRRVLEVPDDNELNATGGVVETVPQEHPQTQPVQPKQPEQPKQPVVEPPERSMRREPLKFKEDVKRLNALFERRSKPIRKIIQDFLTKQKQEIIDNIKPIRSGKKWKKSRVNKTAPKRKLRAQLIGVSDEILEYNKDIFNSMDMELDFGFSHQELNELVEELSETTFAGTVDKVAFDAKDAILPGIKAGASTPELAKLVEDVYANYSKSQLDTVAITLVNDMQNAARLDLYKANPQFVPGVMYDAVMDERTTVFCETHDGLFIRLDNPDIEYLRPPNHFRCRSLYSPVTILDGKFKETYDLDAVVKNAERLDIPTDKLNQAIFPQKKFGRTFFENKYGDNI